MQNMTGLRSFIASFTGSKGQRVKLNSSGGVDLADATNGSGIGVLDQDATTGYPVTVKLFTGSGTFEITVTGAVAAGAVLFPAANGQLSPTSVSANTSAFRAIEAATTAGDIIEVIPCLPNS